MQIRRLATALVIATLSAAVLAAGDETPLTRAEVKSELAHARAAGELNSDVKIRDYVTPVSTAGSGLTRAEVQAELARARASGEYPLAHKFHDVANTAVAAPRTRQEVRAEAIAGSRERLARVNSDAVNGNQ